MKNKINPASFTMIKFLLTLGLIFNYTISLLAFFNVYKNEEGKLLLATKTYLAIQILLFVSSLVCFLIFYFVRIDVNKKTEYKYNKKEKKLIYITLSTIILILLISLINILSISFIFEKIFIMIIVFMVIQLFTGVSTSILESYSRLTEQSIVNQHWFKKEEETKKEQKVKTETKVLKEKENFNPFMQEEDND
ncbi:hypothetical protein [Spiroplasma endosymbiont of Diplazon laetatorius]|uniref:hypothetical protein n=1 Tax=Spiroplasma endosymbiont of Diplazon laetatorius TaxID=3066322 RepID=UPI0030CF7D4C